MAEPAEAAAAVSEAIADARAEGAEAGAAVAEAAAEAAAERVAAAERATETMAAALAQTAMVQRIEALERAVGDGERWREILAGVQATQTQIAEAISSMQSTLQALAMLWVAEETEPEETEPSIPETTDPSGSKPRRGESGDDPASPIRSARTVLRRLI